MGQKENLHVGHRQRMRERFEAAGDLSSFSEHEVVEMMLYPFIPRRNTNEIAHRLLKTFLTINNILNANINELEAVEGISHNTAVNLHFFNEIFSYAHNKDLEQLNISNKKMLEEKLIMAFKGENCETLKALCIDSGYCVRKAETISKGDAVCTSADINKIAKTILNSGCLYLILAHNHPEDECSFSNKDILTTNKLSEALKVFGISILDHYVVSSNHVSSMAANGLLN